MERLFPHLIPNKHIIYIIQEYLREEYTFLSELSHTTELLKRDADHWHTYDGKYTICFEFDNLHLYAKGYKLFRDYPYSKCNGIWKPYDGKYLKTGIKFPF